jgi:hypothetical protein
MSQPDDANSYLTVVITLYLELPETPMRASLADQQLARRLHRDGLPLKTVESALLLGSLRRLIRPQGAPSLSPIRSLAYFLPVIEELTQNPSPENYLDYLRLKLQQILKTRSATGHFSTLPDGR